jgi:hypothetical protein
VRRDVEVDHFALEPVRLQMLAAAEELYACNELTARFGLTLSEQQIQNLIARRFEALKNTGRIEFGGGVMKKLAYAFCDSPYVSQADYEETLSELTDSFYYFKNKSMDRLTDDELIEYMAAVFNGRPRALWSISRAPP